MEAEPVLQEEKPMSRFVYWLLGLLVVGAIFAAAAFMYYQGNSDSSNSTAPAEQPKSTAASIDSEIAQVQTDLTTLSTEIDQELSDLTDSLASTEDDTTDL